MRPRVGLYSPVPTYLVGLERLSKRRRPRALKIICCGHLIPTCRQRPHARLEIPLLSSLPFVTLTQRETKPSLNVNIATHTYVTSLQVNTHRNLAVSPAS